ncbi:MAG: hypothetical protein DRI36_05630 [Caldiserica bacterium]|nr:MAG: hypothetical protein DRI36_05630 [Caldisericota bacterium]
MEKRKRYVVDKDFQIKMVKRVILLVMGGIILSGILSYSIAIYREKKSEVQLYGTTDKYGDDVRIVKRQEIVKPIILKAIVISGIASIIIVGIFMIFYSHRIAGPVYRLRKSLEKVAEGDYSVRITFRKKDEFKELAEAFNKMVDSLEKR